MLTFILISNTPPSDWRGSAPVGGQDGIRPEPVGRLVARTGSHQGEWMNRKSLTPITNGKIRGER